MIAYLNGRILKKIDKGIILNTGNIGYLVHLTKKLISTTEEKDEIEFFIHSHIKEDSFNLYGFLTYQELIFFRELINITGIGPKVAMEILNMPMDKVNDAIINEDITFMSQVPGIGKKTAQRIILEIKGKIDLNNLDRNQKSLEKEFNEDIINALLKFGYKKYHIVRALRDIPKEIKKPEEIITYFLKNTQ